ncbi:MAG: F0F1 ATP synthase subunit alpha [Candidatus Komeilibacteria bacterium]
MAHDYLIKHLQQKIEGLEFTPGEQRVGHIIEVGDGIATVSGLSKALSMEMVQLASKDGQQIDGVVLNLEEDVIGVMILGDYLQLREGDVVRCTGKVLEVPVGEELIGRVVNALGQPVDGKGVLKTEKTYPVEKVAPGVITRQSVSVPLQTGIKSIDSMIPIGRGQRELIIGDRQTGKTAIAIDTILNQKDSGVLCIYVAIAQKESKIAQIIARLQEAGAMAYTTVVVAGASDPAAMSFIAPYAGCSMAEYFMEHGKDVLIIYDDLSKQAVAYRQISLLLRRPPGREAYPGDIFYLHSRLLERSARLNKVNGNGSLTALPIIETQAGDISAYIPTNVISITDGQIFLEADLFYQGFRPAVNVGISVSRVGSAAQIKAIKKIAGRLKLDMAQYRELEAFAQFGSDLDEETQSRLNRGKRIVELLKQGQYRPLPVQYQVAILYAVVNGFLDQVPVDQLKELEQKFYSHLDANYAHLLRDIQKTGELSDENEKKLKQAIEEVTSTLVNN